MLLLVWHQTSPYSCMVLLVWPQKYVFLASEYLYDSKPMSFDLKKLKKRVQAAEPERSDKILEWMRQRFQFYRVLAMCFFLAVSVSSALSLDLVVAATARK